jgi:hypothetical protein
MSCGNKCENCSCGVKPVDGDSFMGDVEEGLVFLFEENLVPHVLDLGGRVIHFCFRISEGWSFEETSYVSIGVAIHNPEDTYDPCIGMGLSGLSLKRDSYDLGVYVSRKAWKSLNSNQKRMFVENWLKNCCMMELLPVSRRAAMGGR